MKNPLKIIKKKWDRYLERMAKNNEKLYGHGKLDCCDLNSNKHKNHELDNCI